MRRRNFLASAAAIGGASALPLRAQSAQSDLIVYAATVRTVDPRARRSQAFVVRNGRFAYVGTRDGARDFASIGARTLDLGGATVLPGLIDAHLHLLYVGQALHEVDL